MKAFKAVQSWDKDPIEFRANHPLFSYFLFALGVLLSIAMLFAEPQEVAQKAQPYFIATALLGFIFSTQNTILVWDKSRQIAHLKRSLLGFQSTRTYSFEDVTLSIQFINANQPRYEKYIDKDWFVLSFSQKKYLLHTQLDVLDSNLEKVRRELELPANNTTTTLRKKEGTGAMFPIVQAITLTALVLLIATAIAVKIAPNLALQRSIENEHLSFGRDIIYDAFGNRFEDVVDCLNQPYKHESLRANESLAYWNFDPVTLQIHFYKNKVSRMAYLSKDNQTRELLVKEIIKQFGGPKEWIPQSIETGEGKRSVVINTREKLTLVKEPGAILVYGYIMTKR